MKSTLILYRKGLCGFFSDPKFAWENFLCQTKCSYYFGPEGVVHTNSRHGSGHKTTDTKVVHTNSRCGSGHKQYTCPSQSASRTGKRRLVYERSQKKQKNLLFVSASNERQSLGGSSNQNGFSWSCVLHGLYIWQNSFCL